MLARRGMPEDRHLCLFAAGWRGLLAWCTGQRGPPLLGAAAARRCRAYVDALAHVRGVQVLTT